MHMTLCAKWDQMLANTERCPWYCTFSPDRPQTWVSLPWSIEEKEVCCASHSSYHWILNETSETDLQLHTRHQAVLASSPRHRTLQREAKHSQKTAEQFRHLHVFFYFNWMQNPHLCLSALFSHNQSSWPSIIPNFENHCSQKASL